MAKYMYYYDERVIRDAGQLIKMKLGEEGQILTALDSTTIDSIIDLFQYVTKPKEVAVLRILAHGRPGKTQLGKDGMGEVTVDRFKAIADRFAPNARIELHSCLVAKQCMGSIFCQLGGWMQKLADYTGANVVAAQEVQKADHEWKWEGNIKTFTPWKPGDDIRKGTYSD